MKKTLINLYTTLGILFFSVPVLAMNLDDEKQITIEPHIQILPNLSSLNLCGNTKIKNSRNSNSVSPKINIDELPNAETEIRFYRRRTGSTTAEKITFKILDDLKGETEKIDMTLVYFNNQIKNNIKEAQIGGM